MLLEPTSIVAKAWDHAERIAQRARSWRPQNVLITGAGPIGLLAALMGKQRGLDVHLFDRNREGIKPALIRDLGAIHHPDLDDLGGFAPDVIMECTGAIAVVKDVLGRTSPGGIVCLLSVTAHRVMEFDIGLVQSEDRARQRCRCSARSTPISTTTACRRRRSRRPTGHGSSA